jgi:hypothetical protein
LCLVLAKLSSTPSICSQVIVLRPQLSVLASQSDILAPH